MSKVPLYTGGGCDDPATISQFTQERVYSSAGISEIDSGSNNIQILNPTGPVVTIVDNGVAQVNQDVGIQVTSAGTAVTIKNTGVRSIISATEDILVTNDGADPDGTGNITLKFQGSGGGGGTLVPAEAFCIMMQRNTDFLVPLDAPDTPLGFYPFAGRSGPNTLWDFVVPPDVSSLVGTTFAFNALQSGTVSLPDTGRFTSNVAGIYIFTATSQARLNNGTGAAAGELIPLCLVKNGNEALLSYDCGSDFVTTRTIFLDVGDYVQLMYYNVQIAPGDQLRILHTDANTNMPGSGQPLVPIFFSGARILQSATTTPAAAAPERFAVTLASDAVVGTGDSAWAPIGNLAQVLDTVTFPDYHPEAIFNDLTVGTLNLSAGTFTVGVTGHYILALTCGNVAGSTQNTTIGFQVNGGKILRGVWDSANAYPNIPFVSFQYLTAGDVIQLVAWDKAGTISKAVVDGVSGVNIPQIIWSGYLVRGGGGGGDRVETEAISVMPAADRTIVTVNSTPFDIVNFTATLDTVEYPTITPTCLYNKLTTSTFDLSTGVFTAGTTGLYRVELDLNQWNTSNVAGAAYLRFKVNGTEIFGPETQYGPSHVFSLTAGDTVSLSGMPNTSAPGGGTYPRTVTLLNGANAPAFTWSIQSLSGGGNSGGGGGGGGAVSPESFCAALSADVTTTAANAYVALAPTTTSVDTVTFTEISPTMLYDNLTTGSYNAATATFTVGVTGSYIFGLPQYASSPGFSFRTVLRIDGNKVISPQDAGNGRFMVFASLVAGQTVQLVFYDSSVDTITYSYSAGQPSLTYAHVWSGSLIGSATGGGGGGTTSPESFSIAMGNDYTTSNTGLPATLSDFIDTVNVLGTPTIDPATLFNSLTAGSINLGTGVFTVGVTGTYYVFWPNNIVGGISAFYPDLLVNDGKRVQPSFTNEAISNTALVSLVAGDTLSLSILDNVVDTIPAVQTTSGGGIDAYSVIWGAALIASASGGGGGGGTVASVVAGAAISVDNTDPANPIVTNTGVRSVTSSHSYLTVNNSDPFNPVLSNNGVLTLATTGGASGLAITGTANNPILRNTGIRSITSGTPATLSVINNNGAVTLSATGGGGGGGGGSGTVVGVAAQLASGAEVPNVGLTITNPTSNVLIQNNAVLRVTGGSGISITGDQRNRSIAIGDIGTGTNYTRFDPTNGFMTMAGTARPWKVKSIPMIYFSTTDSTQAPGSNEIYAGARSWFPSFRNAANINSLTGFWPVPYEMAWQQTGPGQYSTLTYFGINWTPNTTASGNVRWRLRWKYLRAGDLLTAAAPFTTDGVTQAAGGVIGSLRWTGFFAVNLVTSGLPNTGQGDVIAVSVQRDPDDPLDTYPDQALFMGLRIVYQIDQLGGRQNTAR